MVKPKSINKLTYSIVIIVKNDRGIGDSLRRLHGLVGDRTYCEVVVVDASVPNVLADIQKANSWVRWVYYQNHTGKRMTIPEQRNMGIEKSQGDVVVFLDANCVPANGWFDSICQGFEEDGHDVLTGIITSAGERTFHDAGYEGFVHNQQIAECGAANFAVRRSVLGVVGLFDTNMTYGEDVDLAWRISDAGYRIIFRKDMSISHDWGGFREELRRAFRYGTSRTMLYKKHPARIKRLAGQDINVLIYPLFLLLLPATYWLPFYPLLVLVPLVKNIGNRPFQKTLLHFVYGAGSIKGIFRSV